MGDNESIHEYFTIQTNIYLYFRILLEKCYNFGF